MKLFDVRLSGNSALHLHPSPPPLAYPVRHPLGPFSASALLGLVAFDVYATILHSRARAGPIGETLNRGVWSMARGLAFRCSRARRHVILNAVGPLLLPALVATFILFLILGYALIYWPQMPTSFNVDEKARTPPWIEAIYFSGITLTTLGYGDIAPRSTAMRLTALSEVSAGFCVYLAGGDLSAHGHQRPRTQAHRGVVLLPPGPTRGPTPSAFSSIISGAASSRRWKRCSPAPRGICRVCWKATSSIRSSTISTRWKYTRACRGCCFW